MVSFFVVATTYTGLSTQKQTITREKFAGQSPANFFGVHRPNQAIDPEKQIARKKNAGRSPANFFRVHRPNQEGTTERTDERPNERTDGENNELVLIIYKGTPLGV